MGTAAGAAGALDGAPPRLDTPAVCAAAWVPLADAAGAAATAARVAAAMEGAAGSGAIAAAVAGTATGTAVTLSARAGAIAAAAAGGRAAGMEARAGSNPPADQLVHVNSRGSSQSQVTSRSIIVTNLCLQRGEAKACRQAVNSCSDQMSGQKL